jgi:hypothetical protein
MRTVDLPAVEYYFYEDIYVNPSVNHAVIPKILKKTGQ